MKSEIRPIDETMVRCISSNYFSVKCEEETVKALEQGKWVTFCASCIGHTRAAIFESAGERFVLERYGETNIQKVYPNNGYGSAYFRLR